MIKAAVITSGLPPAKAPPDILPETAGSGLKKTLAANFSEQAR
jgi:hypothetical protein